MDATIENLDGPYANAFLNVGNAMDRGMYTKATSNVYLSYSELENLYIQDGMARRIIDLPSEEMTRAGFDLDDIDEQLEIDCITAFETLNLTKKLTEALKWSFLYGGSLIVVLANDGGTLESPLVVERVKSLEQLRVYDRWQVSRHQKYNDPGDMRFGRTEIFLISPLNGVPYYVHESRCLIFDGCSIPERQRELNDGWGASRLQQVNDQLTRFNMSHYWGNGLLERAQQAIHGIPDLTNLLRSPGGEQSVKSRINLVDMARSVNNTVVIDALETYEIKATSLTGVSDLIDRFAQVLCAVCDIPETLLMGKQKTGLSGSNKNDLEYFYSKVKQWQTNMLIEPLDRLIEMQLYVLGAYTPDYKIEFESLMVEDEAVEAEIDYKEAQCAQIYNAMGALDASEVRLSIANKYEIEDPETMPEPTEEDMLALEAMQIANKTALNPPVKKAP